MRYLQEALLEDVLKAHRFLDALTEGWIKRWAPFHIWCIESRSELGAIQSQLQGESEGQDAGRVGTIAELHPGWMKWLASGHAKARSDRECHDHLLSLVRNKQPFETRPIVVGDVKQINDGRHRLFALYEYTSAQSMPAVEIYWNRGNDRSDEDGTV
jgi:hypothetical protein